MTGQQKIECSIIFIDLSGFTQLMYQASYRDEIVENVLDAMQRMFSSAAAAALESDSVRIINTTGDGFIAIATGPTPSRTAVAYVRAIHLQFDRLVKSIIHSLPFRMNITMRGALHHGFVHRFEVDGIGGSPDTVYLGDDLNLLIRVVNSQVARTHTFAITRTFYRRLTLQDDKLLRPADEVILDRNAYPEPVEVYTLPETISEYIPKKRR